MVEYRACLPDPLPFILASLPEDTSRLVLCGPYPGEANRWRRYLSDVPPGWQAKVKVARSNGACDAYLYAPDGRRVRVTSTAVWFGPEPLAPNVAQRLFARLQYHLKHEFHREENVPLVTPAVAGMALWRPSAGEWPELPDDLQEKIRTTSGQARRELLTVPELQEIRGFQAWDMRFAYADFCERLPVGPAELEQTTDLERLPMVGRARVDFRPSRDWAHVGILPSKEYGVGLYFPTDYRWHTGWCDTREARLALSQGWEVRPRAVLRMQEGRPLDTWSRRLKRLWAWFGEESRSVELQGAVRRILLATLGDFQGRGRLELRTMPTVRGTRVEVELEQGRAKERPSHPEWSAAIWARCRYRLARHMLTLPREIILGCHTDCIYLADDPGWGNGAAIGQLRLKGALFCSGPAPHTSGELDALKAAADRDHDEEAEEEE
jgi:hypothetical protein